MIHFLFDLVAIVPGPLLLRSGPGHHADGKEEAMFELGSPLWVIVSRSVLVYLAVFLGLRLAGKRELGQMTVFDLVVVLLISNAVQNAMVGPDLSVQGGIVAAATLLGLDRLAATLRLHGGVWGRLIEGTPSVLVEDGQLIEPHLRKERIERSELEMVLREHGLESLESVRLAVLETDGSISIVPRTSSMVRTRKHVRQMRRR
jgi:uncharacterized membrane protein YcaP (DUF421 family)